MGNVLSSATSTCTQSPGPVLCKKERKTFRRFDDDNFILKKMKFAKYIEENKLRNGTF